MASELRVRLIDDEGVAVEIWLQQQASAVLTALRHAEDLYGGPTSPRMPQPFAPRRDLESVFGGTLV
jgi:hypothetical protein